MPSRSKIASSPTFQISLQTAIPSSARPPSSSGSGLDCDWRMESMALVISCPMTGSSSLSIASPL